MCTQINLFMNHSSFSLSVSPHTPLRGLLPYNQLIQHNFFYTILALSCVLRLWIFIFFFLFFLKSEFVLDFVVSHAQDCSYFFFFYFSFNKRFEKFFFLVLLLLGFHAFGVLKCLTAFYGAAINEL